MIHSTLLMIILPHGCAIFLFNAYTVSKFTEIPFQMVSYTLRHDNMAL